MADAQYVIDIASNMVGGNETLAELDGLTAKLMSGGRNADFFQQAIAQVGRQLDAASAAAKTANAALAAGEAEYSRLEKAALQVSKAAEKAAVQNEGVMPPEAVAFIQAGKDALNKQADALRVLEANAKKANDAETALTKTQKNLSTLNGHVNTSLAQQGEAFEKIRGGLSAAGGSLGQLGSKLLAPVQSFSKLSATMGASNAAALLGVAAFAALAVAAVALTAAVTVATVKFAAWAVGLADSARAAGLAQDALEAIHPELASVRGQLDALTNATGLGRDRLNALAASLTKAGVGAKDLPIALRAAALAEAALGQGGASEFIEKIKAGTLAVSDFSKQTEAKLGGIVAKQMLGLDAQSERLKREIGEIFGGLNIDPVLSGMKILVDLFDKSTVAGQALKFLFESVFQPLIDHAEQAAQVVEAFYLGVLIGGVKMYIALKPAIKAISELFGFEDTGFADTLSLVTKAAELLAPGIALVAAGVLGLTAAVGALLALAVGLPALVIAPFVAFGYAATQAWAKLSDGLTGALAYLKSINWVQIGLDIISGIVLGLVPGPVITAIGNVARGAIDAAKSVLGIHSPSKVFGEIGDNTVEGFSGAVEDGAKDAHEAISGLVSPPANDNAKQAALSGDIGSLGALASSTPVPAAAGAPAPAGGGGHTVSGNTFNFYGVEGAADAERRMVEAITRTLEGDATQLASTGTDG